MISSLRCWNQYQEHGRPTTWTPSFQRQNFFLPFSNDKTTKRKIFLAGLLWWPCIEISLISLLRKNWSEWSVNWEKSVIGDQWSDGRADRDGDEIGDQGGKRPHRHNHKSSHSGCISIFHNGDVYCVLTDLKLDSACLKWRPRKKRPQIQPQAHINSSQWGFGCVLPHWYYKWPRQIPQSLSSILSTSSFMILQA